MGDECKEKRKGKMIIPRAKCLNLSGLKSYARQLEQDRNKMVLFRTLGAMPIGSELIKELKENRNFIRDMYSAIPPESKDAVVLLASIQSLERQLGEWIKKFTNTDAALEELVREETEIKKIMEHREQQTPRSSFLPKVLREENQKQLQKEKDHAVGQ